MYRLCLIGAPLFNDENTVTIIGGNLNSVMPNQRIDRPRYKNLRGPRRTLAGAVQRADIVGDNGTTADLMKNAGSRIFD